MSHRFWHGAYPELFSEVDVPALAADEANALRAAWVGIDRPLGDLAAAQGPDDTLIVVSDHGFQAQTEASDIWVAHFDEVLEAAGLVSGRDGFQLVSTFFAVTLRIAPGPVDERDALIERLRGLLESYTTLDGEALMYVVTLDIAPRPAGTERSFVERAQQWVTRRALDWAFQVVPDPTAQAMVFGLPKRSVLAAMEPDASLRVDGREMPRHRAFYRQRFTGTHHPTAVFVASGGPIARLAKRRKLSVLDVAPLVVYLAGDAIPDDLDGRLPTEWIAAAHLAANPPRHVSAASMPGLTRPSPDALGEAADGSHDPALIEKLRALGYVE
jgi:hypothetical protein